MRLNLCESADANRLPKKRLNRIFVIWGERTYDRRPDSGINSTFSFSSTEIGHIQNAVYLNDFEWRPTELRGGPLSNLLGNRAIDRSTRRFWRYPI
jgi:hypothetical protein